MFTHSCFKDFAVYDNLQKGAPVVFLHGLGANASYGEFLTEVYPQNRILLIDLPGHGESIFKKEEIDIYLIAKELHILFEHYGIQKPILCGHSLGAQIAFLYDIVHPHHTDSMILISPAGLEDFNEFQKQTILSSLSFGNFMHQMFIPKISTRLKVREGLFPKAQIISGYIRSMMDRPVKPLLKNITCPTHVIFGENDVLIPNRVFSMDSVISFAHKVLDPFHQFKILPLPNCGHWPMAENLKGLVKLMKESK